MTRPAWMMVVTAGLGACLAPGCFRPWLKDSSESVQQVSPDSREIWTGRIVSPYQPLPERTVHWQDEIKDAVAPASFPDAERKQDTKANNKADPDRENTERAADKRSQVIELGPPTPPDPPLVAALRALMEKRPAEALDLLKGYERASQELLLSLLPLAVRLTEGGLQQPNPGELAAVLEQLRALERPLAERAALGIDKMCLCRRIESYGVYQKVPEDWAYAAGVGDQPGELVQVYVELRNFASKQQGNSFETCLTSSLEIHDYRGNLVWRRDFPAQPDHSHSARHDYFINYRFAVPPHVPPGSYVLWIQVKDLTGQPGKDAPAYRTARRSLDFRVHGTGTGRGSWGEPGVVLKSGEADHDLRRQGADGEGP
jgi:hypothetical protein